MMDDNEILFKESQGFTQWWLWLILTVINGFLLFGVYKQVIGGEAIGDKPMSDTGLLLNTGFMIALTVLFTRFRLHTEIKQDGVYVKFFPFHLSFKHYRWTSISKSYVRQYNPIAEYGGWGLRLGLFGKGKAYNVSGNQGLQLEFYNQKKLLIGTNKPMELLKVLKKIEHLKE